MYSLSSGARVNAKDSMWLTPLHRAVASRSEVSTQETFIRCLLIDLNTWTLQLQIIYFHLSLFSASFSATQPNFMSSFTISVSLLFGHCRGLLTATSRPSHCTFSSPYMFKPSQCGFSGLMTKTTDM